MTFVRQQTIDISGFGDGYEDTCQRMLWKGVAYLAEVNPPTEMWDDTKQSANIIGVLHVEGDEVKTLEKAMMRGEGDVTGAMHQAVMNHLAYIHRHTLEGWLKAASAAGREVIEWEGEIAGAEAVPLAERSEA